MCQNKYNECLERLDNFERILETRVALHLSKMSDEQKNMTMGEVSGATFILGMELLYNLVCHNVCKATIYLKITQPQI